MRFRSFTTGRDRRLVLMHDIRPAEQSDTEMVVDAAALSRIRMR